MAEEEAQLNTITDDHQREENQEDDASHSRDEDTNSSLLSGLNLALIISSLTPSQFQNPKGAGEIETLKTSHAIRASSNIPRVRRQPNHGIRGVEKQVMPNPNTKIRACRHGRKM